MIKNDVDIFSLFQSSIDVVLIILGDPLYYFYQQCLSYYLSTFRISKQMSQDKSKLLSMQTVHQELQMSLLNSQEEIAPAQKALQEENWPRCIKFENSDVLYKHNTEKQIPNLIRNQKYSIITFVPQVLYEQFKYFFNMFYLLTALSQFIPALKVGLLFSFLAPLVLVLVLTMLKEAYEDYQRFLKDKQINSAEFTTWYHENKIVKKSSQLKVGDIVEIASGSSSPADCILLRSFSEKGSIFLKTDQLDGETDWKLRKQTITMGQQHKNDKTEKNEKTEKSDSNENNDNNDNSEKSTKKMVISQQLPHKFMIMLDEPEINIYKFIGAMKIEQKQVFGIGLQNTIWRGVKIATGKALVMVIYTGKQTKLSLNMKHAQTKFGKLDWELNFFSKILFTVMVSLSLMLLLMRGFEGTPGSNSILFFKYFLLLSSIIPISMRVNLDFAKLVYKYLIDHDKQMITPLCRNSNIPEQLGRIQYILTDKTGTLTQNEMVFKRLFVSQSCKYEIDDTASLQQILKSGIKPYSKLQFGKKVNRESQYVTIDAILALMICHNVTPVFEDDGERVLQGSSPDEITLVRFGEELGFKLKDRSQDYMEIVDRNGEVYQFDIMLIFPFTSESKRMGIIVKERKSKQLVLYLKGADIVIQSKISSLDSDFMKQACEQLAREGLRTLVITQKLLSQECNTCYNIVYDKWKKVYDQSNSALKDREKKIDECRQTLQSSMDFLGITGVEDKLQQHVIQTVHSACSIGIKVWMLTGDKIETAMCVGRAIGLIRGKMAKIFVIEGVSNENELKQKIQLFYNYVQIKDGKQVKDLQKINCVLVIDGASLKFALTEMQQDFFNIAVRLPGIICSRVSPTQKAEVAALVIKYNKSDGRVLGIGDGGNDVALIQSAHVGVGIYGKEGIQAALASDFSIGQFKDLNQLMYWHGRLSYKRSSLLAQFIIHRGVIITIMQTIFIIQFYFVPIPIYNGVLMLGYSTIFTMLPVFSLVLDEDISRQVAQKYPILYKAIKDGNEVSSQSFLYWMLISMYQGAIIMILITVFVSKKTFYMVTTVSFTCLIFIEFLNVFTQLNKIHVAQIISTMISVLMYILSIFLMKSVLNGVELFSSSCFPFTILIVLVAWGPPFAYETAKRCLYPNQSQKIMKQAQIKSFL